MSFQGKRSGWRYAGGFGEAGIQEDLFFATGGVECLGGERMEGFDAHGFEWGKYRSGEGGGREDFREVLSGGSIEIHT